MSNRRRIRKTYKQQQQEVVTEVPELEIIEEKLWSLSEWMEGHWRPVVAVLGAATVLWGAIGLYQILAERGVRSTAAANAPVYAAAGRAIYAPAADAPADDPAKPLGATFASDKERAEAVVSAGTGLDGEEKVMAEVVVGAAKGVLGQADAQLAALDAAIAAAGEGPLVLALQAQRASALTAAGKAAEAAEAWGKVAAAAPNAALKGMAQVRLGDIFNAHAGSKAPDAAKAKAAYEAAIAALAVDGKAPTDGNAGFLHIEATAKLGQL